MKGLLLAAAALAAVAGMSGAPSGASPARHSPRLHQVSAGQQPLRLQQRCVTAAERRRVVRFTASDRTRLIGLVLGAGARGVVLAHQGGRPGNLCGWVPYARALAAGGYRVILFDHRGRGSSGRAPRWQNWQRVDLDVAAATGVLRKRGVRSVVLAGASLGGTAVLTAAITIQPPVQGVVSLSAPETFVRLDGRAAAAKLVVPILFLATEDDAGGQFATDARTLFDAAAVTDKRVEIFPGFVHGEPMLRDPAVKSLVDSWIAAHQAA